MTPLKEEGEGGLLELRGGWGLSSGLASGGGDSCREQGKGTILKYARALVLFKKASRREKLVNQRLNCRGIISS